MAEQILHGSNVVTAAEQGRRERVAEGVRCGGLRDACLCIPVMLTPISSDCDPLALEVLAHLFQRW